MTTVEVAANPWVGPVLALTPSSVEDWQRCRRLYRTRHLLDLANSDPLHRRSTGVGLEVHRLLEMVHTEGCCGDVAATSTLVRRGVSQGSGEPVGKFGPGGRAGCRMNADLIQGYLARHASRCPGAGSTWSAHELTLAAYHRSRSEQRPSSPAAGTPGPAGAAPTGQSASSALAMVVRPDRSNRHRVPRCRPPSTGWPPGPRSRCRALTTVLGLDYVPAGCHLPGCWQGQVRDGLRHCRLHYSNSGPVLLGSIIPVAGPNAWLHFLDLRV